MMPFNDVILLNHKGVLLTAKELDSRPDADGYVSFVISVDERDSVIYINMDYFRPPVFYTPEDVEDYFEKINYPQLPPAFSNEEVFTPVELFIIGQDIATYILQEQNRSELKK